jgi:hypothetical protein
MSDKDEWTAEEEVGLMMLIIGLIVSGVAIYAIVHLMGWLGLAIVWLFCGLSSNTALELALPPGKDAESKEERRGDIYAATFLYLVGGVVFTIILFFMAISGALPFEEPAEVEPSAA